MNKPAGTRRQLLRTLCP